ncbi:hypothetical protein [Inquilinus sp. CA228]|uniref:hypothetical protein n=1 Tax=Inquilinus sp. CA228 TaxID=3455609 RepID=UPI003F8D59EB
MVADQMVETLAAAGVEQIYGIVGDSLNGFTDSLRRAMAASGGYMSGTRASRPSPPAPMGGRWSVKDRTPPV